MSSVFRFDLEKTLAAVAFLIEREGGKLDMFLSIKMLYLADKDALISWGKTITGDEFVALPKGPVLSAIYDLFKGKGKANALKRWAEVFTEKVDHAIQLRKAVDIEVLSQREMDALERARQEVHTCAPWDVADWLHETCPEWTDPGKGSLSIDPDVILRNAGKSEQEIAIIEESNTFHSGALTLLGL